MKKCFVYKLYKTKIFPNKKCLCKMFIGSLISLLESDLSNMVTDEFRGRRFRTSCVVPCTLGTGGALLHHGLYYDITVVRYASQWREKSMGSNANIFHRNIDIIFLVFLRIHFRHVDSYTPYGLTDLLHASHRLTAYNTVVAAATAATAKRPSKCRFAYDDLYWFTAETIL